MSTSAANVSGFSLPRPSLPAAAVEICAGFALLAVASLAFVTGWLTPNGAAVLTVALLGSLLVLSWNRFDQGRHPCFLFLGTLTLLQGGRLIAFCVGGDDWPLRVGGMAPFPFDLTRSESGIALLCIALSALCVYAPCRWNYRRVAPPDVRPVKPYLPYLYLLFYLSLPIQLFKNYKYYEYIQQHGGYVYFFVNHGDVAASVPLLVRAIVLITFPVFVAIFVFERRKKFLYPATAAYFATSVLTLLMGLRGGLFALILTLWYVAGMKSTRQRRIVAIGALVLVLVLVGDVIQSLREDTSWAEYAFAPVEFVKLQGNSLDVTSVAVKYRDVFRPYIASYLWTEVQNAFVANDASNYHRGKSLVFDVPVLLNRETFSAGYGTGGSYLGEAYVLGGMAGVAVISLLIGCGLHGLYRLSGNAFWLFVVAMIFPEVLGMPRGQLLDWFSVLLRSFLSILILGFGWMLYRILIWLRSSPLRNGTVVAQPGTAG